MISRILVEPRETALPPGDDGLPLVGETIEFLKDPAAFVVERHRRHGAVFRTHLMGQPTVAFVGPAASRFVLATGMRCFSWADGWPSTFKALLAGSLFMADGYAHQATRRLLMPAFHGRAIAGYTAIIEDRTRAHLDRLARLGRFAWLDEMRKLTFDIAARLFLGADPGADVDALAGHMSAFVGGLLSLPVRLPWTPFGRALRARDALLTWVDGAISRREAHPGEDALSLLVEARDERGGRMSRAELRAQALLLLFAGHETMTSMLTSLGLVFAQRPDVLERARREQDAIGGALGQAELERMTYLDAVLREIERCHPPVALGFRGVVEAFDYEGFHIPRGYRALYAIHATHNDAAVFEDPDRFDPGRFDADRADADQRAFRLIGFGGGPRVCLGMALARVELAIIGAQLLRGYTWELEPQQDLTIVTTPTAHPKDGLKVRFSRRG